MLRMQNRVVLFRGVPEGFVPTLLVKIYRLNLAATRRTYTNPLDELLRVGAKDTIYEDSMTLGLNPSLSLGPRPGADFYAETDGSGSFWRLDAFAREAWKEQARGHNRKAQRFWKTTFIDRDWIDSVLDAVLGASLSSDDDTMLEDQINCNVLAGLFPHLSKFTPDQNTDLLNIFESDIWAARGAFRLEPAQPSPSATGSPPWTSSHRGDLARGMQEPTPRCHPHLSRRRPKEPRHKALSLCAAFDVRFLREDTEVFRWLSDRLGEDRENRERLTRCTGGKPSPLGMVVRDYSPREYLQLQEAVMARLGIMRISNTEVTASRQFPTGKKCSAQWLPGQWLATNGWIIATSIFELQYI
ncbi:hypothetical protein DFH09DRAFT_1459152 [Mycena vulgaris]|nr:hypothetical protein DFH09DRAFT_1459152 [Mycena vulgaris]